MKLSRFHIALGVALGILLMILFVKRSEHFTDGSYCSDTNSCLSAGCSLDPGNQPCDRNRTVQAKFYDNDPDWGSILGGQTIPICVSKAGGVIPSVDCAKCSTCGSIFPPTGNALKRICVPLTTTGCLAFDAPQKLIDYLNKDPGGLTCCGLGAQRGSSVTTPSSSIPAPSTTNLITSSELGVSSSNVDMDRVKNTSISFDDLSSDEKMKRLELIMSGEITAR